MSTKNTDTGVVDLGSFNIEQAAEEGSFLHLIHPVTGVELYTKSGEKIGMDLAGMDSARYRNKRAAIINKKMGGRQRKETFERTVAESTDLLAACVLKCHHMVFDGEEANRDNIKAIMTKHSWVREQADEHIGDRANFSSK